MSGKDLGAQFRMQNPDEIKRRHKEKRISFAQELFAQLTSGEIKYGTLAEMIKCEDRMRGLLYKAGVTINSLRPGSSNEEVEQMILGAKKSHFPAVFSASDNSRLPHRNYNIF